MMNFANTWAGCNNPMHKMGAQLTEKFAEATLAAMSATGANMLEFNQDLCRCTNADGAWAAVSNLIRKNNMAMVAAAQKSCDTALQAFSDAGNQCACAWEGMGKKFGGKMKAEKAE